MQDNNQYEPNDNNEEFYVHIPRLKPSVGWIAYLLLIALSFILGIFLFFFFSFFFSIIGFRGYQFGTNFMQLLNLFTPLLSAICIINYIKYNLRIPAKKLLLLNPSKHWGYYLVGVIGIISLNLLIDFIWNLLYPLFPSLLDEYSTFLDNYTSTSPFTMVLIIILGSFGAGIIEELMFRGLIQRSFLSKYDPNVAILLTSAMFGVIHFNIVQGISTFFIGIFLGIITYKSKSIYPAITAHITNNLISLILINLGIV